MGQAPLWAGTAQRLLATNTVTAGRVSLTPAKKAVLAREALAAEIDTVRAAWRSVAADPLQRKRKRQDFNSSKGDLLPAVAPPGAAANEHAPPDATPNRKKGRQSALITREKHWSVFPRNAFPLELRSGTHSPCCGKCLDRGETHRDAA